MSSIRDQLLKLGLVSKEQAGRAAAEGAIKQFEEAEAMLRVNREARNATELNQCSTVKEFKTMAKELLTQNPSLAGEVLEKAHRLKKEEGGKHLVWLLYQVRDAVSKENAREAEIRVVKLAFRKSGSKIGDND